MLVALLRFLETCSLVCMLWHASVVCMLCYYKRCAEVGGPASRRYARGFFCLGETLFGLVFAPLQRTV